MGLVLRSGHLRITACADYSTESEGHEFSPASGMNAELGPIGHVFLQEANVSLVSLVNDKKPIGKEIAVFFCLTIPL